MLFKHREKSYTISRIWGSVVLYVELIWFFRGSDLQLFEDITIYVIHRMNEIVEYKNHSGSMAFNSSRW